MSVSPTTKEPINNSNTSTSSKEEHTKMLFGTKLEREIYQPWREHYIKYNQLKKLLKEGVILKNNWTDKDEQTFVSALDENLESVFGFQHEKFDELNDELNHLQSLTESPKDDFDVDSFSKKLDSILEQAQLLEHFQRLNYTGFIKIVKKHDRLHPNYSVKALLNVRLKKLPFHSEDYSPLLYKVGTLFQFLRDNYEVDQSLSKLSSFNDGALSGEFQSFKFWIHRDNLMEVKTTILRHLPVLIYKSGLGDNNDDDDDDDEDEEAEQGDNDQTINCLYFDNEHFDLYNHKLTKLNNSSTLRIKWIGKLSDKPKISLERKEFDVNSNFHMDEKIELRQKYINDFIINKNIPKKLVKLNGEEPVKTLLEFIKEHSLQPVLRTTYNRTAFQIPGDDKIRIIIDSNLTFIREDSFDPQLPIRDPQQWHRLDLDNAKNPQQFLRKGEFNKFPFSTMEIKIKKSSVKNFKKLQWINELINSSYLVKEIPNFSKFIHGVASLFLEDDKLDNIPMWFNELEADLINDDVPRIPTSASSSNQIASISDEDNLSKFKSMILKNNTSNFQPRSASFSGSMLYSTKEDDESIETPPPPAQITTIIEESSAKPVTPSYGLAGATTDDQSSDFEDEDESDLPKPSPLTRLLHIPSKLLNVDSEDEEIDLPVGVSKPNEWIKNMGPIKIEPKVWLANERTFNRWLHVTTLLSSLTFIIYSSTMASNFEGLSTFLAYFYFGLTLFSGVWGYYIFMKRRQIIMERSDKHLDNSIGPLIIAVGLIVALIINFIFGWKNLNLEDPEHQVFYMENPMHKKIHDFVVSLVK
ncbi:phosphate metabolism transcription protein [Spathaspora passalidarum NRRL Y-27907]|uniref:Phosphate metabolism transcription protein n=1 Tax=Spathaspora passalidarum (strain NRRL Y-27907 / 11-Y1) TaxID=619300 RepID=G3AHZ3_SPAPN|nr:phosphate metabolism transcription protein [Spathaspora passalidarum NRRL Y-27907]EGW34307.1 phosphate metabolism transcription protein [Spathaspora passalidarum NRRL Y-27907]